MYTPVGGKAPSVPLGAFTCSPWEPQGAASARWCGARVCVCLLVVCHIVPCLAGHVAGVSVPQCGVWRLGWLGSCFGAVAFRPAQRAGFGVTLPCPPARGSRGASPWSLACPWWGSGGKEYWLVSKPPPRSLTLLTFWAAGNVSLAPFSQVTCAESAPAPQTFNFPRGGARRSHRRTYPLILALEGNVLDDFLITFPWSSVRPWVPRVWLAPWPGPSWVRLAGEEG